MISADLHSIASFSLEQKTVDSIKNALEGSVGSPVTVKDTVADAAVAVDVGVEDRSNKTTLGRESREIFRHLEVQQEVAAFVWSVRRLQNKLVSCFEVEIMRFETHALNDNLPEEHVGFRNITIVHRIRVGSHVAHLDEEARRSKRGKTGLQTCI